MPVPTALPMAHRRDHLMKKSTCERLGFGERSANSVGSEVKQFGDEKDLIFVLVGVVLDNSQRPSECAHKTRETLKT